MDTKLLRIIDTLYSSCATTGEWNGVLQQVVETAEAAGGAMILHDLRTSVTDGVYTHSDLKELDKFVNYYAKINPWMPKESPQLAQGGYVVSSETFCPLTKMKETEFFNDWGRKNETVYSIAANLGIRSGHFKYFSVYRGESAGPFRESVVQLFEQLTPHLLNVVAIREKLSLIGDLNQVLESTSCPAFVLDRDGKVLHMSSTAEALCREGDLVTLGVRGNLLFALQHADTIASEIRGMLASKVPFRLGRIRKSAGQADAMFLLSVARSNAPASDPRFILAVMDADVAFDEAYKQVGQVYGLTPTETRFAQSLVTAGSLDLTIEALKMNRNTAKKHMAAIFDKTGSNRQGQVIRLFSVLGRIYPPG